MKEAWTDIGPSFMTPEFNLEDLGSDEEPDSQTSAAKQDLQQLKQHLDASLGRIKKKSRPKVRVLDSTPKKGFGLKLTHMFCQIRVRDLALTPRLKDLSRICSPMLTSIMSARILKNRALL